MKMMTDCVGEVVTVICERLREDKTLKNRTFVSPDWIEELQRDVPYIHLIPVWRKLV